LIEIAIGLGVAFSLIFHEVFGLAAGGIVVPGYIALSFNDPFMLVSTIIVALMAWLSIRIISRFVFVYGRRRMVLAVLLGFLFGYTTRQIIPAESFSIFNWNLEAIGYIIPGLIANRMERQGVYKTITTVLIAGAMVRLMVILATGGGLIQNV